MATQSSGGAENLKGTNRREGTATATLNEQISQAVQSTANLIHLMQQSSPSQAQLMKLPKNLMAQTLTIKNTGEVLEQMPRVISSLDAHMETGLQRSFLHLLANMGSWQVSPLSQAHLNDLIPEEKESHQANEHSGIG